MNRSLSLSTAFALIPLAIVAGGASPAFAAQRPPSLMYLSARATGHLQLEVQAKTVYAPGGPYMAAAYSKSKGTAGLSTGATQSDAEYNALLYCDKLTSNANCQGARWVLHGWLALAEYNMGSASSPNIQDWGISDGKTAQDAENNAVSFCDQIAGADVCKYIGQEQSPSTTQPYTYGSPNIGTNDYPTYLATPPLDSLTDAWDFFSRECTSFVAWRINDSNGVYFANTMTGPNGKTATFGNGVNWMTAATSIGYTYNTTPTARSIAWWGDDYHGAGSTGHVAYVDSVTMNGSQVAGITVEQYNWGIPLNQGNYSTLYIPVGSGNYPEGFIHGLEGTQLVTG